MITEIETYFDKGCGRCNRFATAACSAHIWNKGLRALRDLALAAGLDEQVKWGHPCYVHTGRNIAIIGAFRHDFRLSFFNAPLLQDPEGILEKKGAFTQHADMIRFTQNGAVKKMAPVITKYLREAIGYAEAGITPPRIPREVPIPDELITALDADPELAEAFHALTPGRQKSYAFNLNQAKTSKTRFARIEKFRGKILAGKGAQERS